MTIRFTAATLLAIMASASASAQTDPAALYQANCAACHDGDVRAPNRQTLELKTSDSILASMISGTMVGPVRGLTMAEKRAIAELLGTPAPRANATPEPSLCAASPLRNPATGPRWTGWGADPENTRFQKRAGLRAEDVPKLKLKWAFGFPGATAAYAQPAVAGGRVFVGSATGAVYALDAKTGCAHWSYTAPAPVRTAISIGRVAGAAPSQHAVFFGDLAATVHALDASTGVRIWSRKLDPHAAARITGAPALYGTRLYVPVSSGEEFAGAHEGYECCTFRGSVAALDAATGAVIWQTYTIADAPRQTRKTPKGAQLWGPSGAAIWVAPTIDAARRVLYVGTGNAYSTPATETSDAILALDMDTGKIRWSRQITPNDVFVVNCREGNPNCPDDVGPDFGFGSSPILRTSGGRRVLVVGQKSGVAYGLDPDRNGAIVWEFRAGKGGGLAGIAWGMAADEEQVYIPVSDLLEP